jgi:hypothetical protein
MEEKMLIVNIGEQGFTKVIHGEKGAIRETKHFPPNVPVECSAEMAVGLLKKYNNPTMKIIMRSAEGFALIDPPVVPIIPATDEPLIDGEEDEPIAADDPMRGHIAQKKKQKRGRPRK